MKNRQIADRALLQSLTIFVYVLAVRALCKTARVAETIILVKIDAVSNSSDFVILECVDSGRMVSATLAVLHNARTEKSISRTFLIEVAHFNFFRKSSMSKSKMSADIHIRRVGYLRCFLEPRTSTKKSAENGLVATTMIDMSKSKQVFIWLGSAAEPSSRCTRPCSTPSGRRSMSRPGRRGDAW